MDHTTWWRALLRPAALVPSGVVLAVTVACLGAPLWAPADPNENDLSATLLRPSGSHWLGTDELGRDILSRLLYGGRTSLLDALVVVVVSIAFAVPIALVAGFVGGWFDRLVTAAVETGMAIPVIILTLVVVTVFRSHYTVALVALAIFMAPPLIRNVRGPVLAMRRELYVDAARVAGVRTRVIVFRHVFRRILGPILVQSTLIACMSLQMTVALAYLGFGSNPPNPTWGSMVSEGASIIYQSSWLLLVSGAVIGVSVLCAGVLGDVIRDATVGSWTRVPTGAPTQVALAPAQLADTSRGDATGAADNNDCLLRVRNLSVAYDRSGQGTTVASDVSFDVRAGEAVGLVGESGCGKTTVARSLLRMGGQIVSGSLTFDGRIVLSLSAKELSGFRGSAIGYISQEPMAALDPTMRVGALIAEVVRRHENLPRAGVKGRVMELLAMVRLPEPDKVARRYPFELSGGMAQRVAIARALAGRPRLLVADEPTTALDVTVQSEILDLLNTLRSETGMALLIVSHNWGVISKMCDRGIVMYAGQVVEQAATSRLVSAPAHPYTRLLLASQPRPDTPRDLDLPTIPGSVADPSSWPSACRFAERCPLATPECSQHPIALRPLGTGAESRCIHIDQVNPEVAAHAR